VSTVDSVLVRDVVVVIPGIMGSALVHDERGPVWSLGTGSLINAIRTLGGSLQALTLPKDLGDEHPEDGVCAVDLLPSLHVIPGLWSPITGYDGLLSFLRSARFHLVEADPRDPDRMPNLVTFPYDWRLSNRLNARLLAKTVVPILERWQSQPGMADAKLVLFCHSMGGLIARWFLEREGGAEITRTVVTMGTPYRGALKALDSLSNGLEFGIGPMRLRLTDFARSLPSLHQLLPTYDCLENDHGSRTGLKGVDIPGIDSTMLADALAFHADLDARPMPTYALHKVVGIRQPTLTTAVMVKGAVVPSEEIDGRNQGGDGTVPVLAAQPILGRGVEVHEVADQHGELQGARSVLDLLDGILTREEIIWQDAAPESLGVSMANVWFPLSRPALRVTGAGDRRLHVTVLDERDQRVAGPVIVEPDGSAALEPLAPGGYRAVVKSPVRGGPPPVTHPFLVWEEAAPAASMEST
jgi:pimeloyl-ACP methyl ester carboxylesterase